VFEVWQFLDMYQYTLRRSLLLLVNRKHRELGVYTHAGAKLAQGHILMEL
jgi:hypothetical protein